MKPLLKIFKQMTLKAKLIASFIFVIIVTITIYSLINHYNWKKDYFRRVTDEGTILTQTIAQGSADPILRNDFQALEELIANLTRQKNILYVLISDRHNHVISQSDSAQYVPAGIISNGLENITPVLVQTYRNDHWKMDINDISVPIVIDNEKWGAIQVGFSLQHLEDEIYRSINAALITALTSIIVGIVASLILMRFITRPMAAFIRSMKDISSGDLQKEINIDPSSEFRVMADSFNRMALSLKENREELGRTYEELAQKHKMAAIGEFSARIAHEIKNPLGIIKGSAQILLSPDTPPVVKEEVCGYIVEEVDRLNTKVMDILDFARPKMMSTEPVDINEALENAILFWETLHGKDKNISLLRRLNHGLPPVNAAPELMRQVILNLLVNADEAMDVGGELVITTGLKEDCWLSITFRDNGRGIPMEQIEKIFDPFFTTKSNGTGLGLSIVRQIIENHNGKINVTSTVGSGTEVEILLPITSTGA